MKNLKKSFAMLLCFVMAAVCFAGCHQKDEIAVKVGDCEFTSGYYSCALVIADTEARSKVETELSDKGESTDNITYYKHKVEDTDYVEWVKNKALDTLKQLAAVKTLCKEANVELDEETATTAKENSEYMWDSYGYSQLMEPNGVSKSTFLQYMNDTYLADTYFTSVYGENGEKAISSEKLSEYMTENYVLVNRLDVSFDSKSDDEKTSLSEKFTTYESELKNGKRSFEEIYLEYNNISADEHTHEDAEDGELSPQDHHATVLGAEGTSYEIDYFDDAKKMALGEVKVLTLDNDRGLVLLVKKDISADPYYLKTLDSVLRHDIADEEYNEYIEKYADDMKLTVNKSSVNRFNVKKIKYPTSTN